MTILLYGFALVGGVLIGSLIGIVLVVLFLRYLADPLIDFIFGR